MATPTLATKLYIPPPRHKVVHRPHLVERLNAGLAEGHKLTLISAAAGFGKTTLLSEWVSDLQSRCGRKAPSTIDAVQAEAAGVEKIVNQVAWLSLDEGDNDPRLFGNWRQEAGGKTLAQRGIKTRPFPNTSGID